MFAVATHVAPAEAETSKPVRIAELEEVLPRVRILDPAVGEMLEAQRPLGLLVGAEAPPPSGKLRIGLAFPVRIANPGATS